VILLQLLVFTPITMAIFEATTTGQRRAFPIIRRTLTNPIVVGSVLGMLEGGATHVGVATDHVVESFRNALWAGYKTGEGMDPVLCAQFQPLEAALSALGVVVWPMVEFEADDALAAAAVMAAADARVNQVVVCTPDKDLAQCVRGDRIVQLDRRFDAGFAIARDGRAWATPVSDSYFVLSGAGGETIVRHVNTAPPDNETAIFNGYRGSSLSLPLCKPRWPAGEPRVIIPTTSTRGGNRVTRSAAMMLPRLWASSTIGPDSGRPASTRCSVLARVASSSPQRLVGSSRYAESSPPGNR